MNIKKLLHKPYPYSRGIKRELVYTGLICIFITLLLFMFRPFGLHLASYYLIISFGIVAYLSSFFNTLVINNFLLRFIQADQWKVWQEIIRSFLFLVLNALTLYFFALSTIDIYAPQILGKFMLITLVLSIIPITIKTLLTENWLLRKGLNDQENKTEKHIDNRTSETGVLLLESDQVKEKLYTDIHSLYYLEAQQNYLKVVEGNTGKTNSKLIRLSLVNALKQINTKYIVRSHRSYVVNLLKVDKVKKYHQSMFLELKEIDQKIPVSKTYKNEVLQKLKTFKD